MKRIDPLTNEAFTPSRANMRFASKENRIKYYNNKANAFRYSAAFANKPLYTNLKILNELMVNKKEATFHKQFLIGKGFNFSFFTSYVVLDGKSNFAVYQYIIIKELNSIKIKKNDAN